MLFLLFLLGDDVGVSDHQTDDPVVFQEGGLELVVKGLVESGGVGMTAGGVFGRDVGPEVFE